MSEAAAHNDNSASMPRRVIDLETLSQDELAGLLLYMFGVVDVINSANRSMCFDLATLSELSETQAVILNRWQSTLNEINAHANGHLKLFVAPPHAMN